MVETTKIYRGTWREILELQNEIPAGSAVEVKVFETKVGARNDVGNYGMSVYEKFKDLFGTVEGLPPDLSTNKEKYLEGFGETPEGGPSKP